MSEGREAARSSATRCSVWYCLCEGVATRGGPGWLCRKHADDYDGSGWGEAPSAGRQTTPTFDTGSLPPLQEMVMEVLAARYRLGEQMWPFRRVAHMTKTLEMLSLLGLIGYKSGIVDGTYNAWLTDYGKASVLSDTYVLPEDRS